MLGKQEPLFLVGTSILDNVGSPKKRMKLTGPSFTYAKPCSRSLFMRVREWEPKGFMFVCLVLYGIACIYSLRSEILVGEMDVSRRILVLDTFIFATSNSGRREY